MTDFQSFSRTLGASKAHPRGEFVGVIKGVTKKETQHNQPYWAVSTKTEHGNCPDLFLFGVTDAEFQNAMAQAQYGKTDQLDKIKRNVTTIKSMLARFGVTTIEQASSMSFAECTDALQHLVGQSATIRIVERRDNPAYSNVMLDPVKAEQMVNVNQQAPAAQQQQWGQPNQPQSMPQSTPQGAQKWDVNNIPF